MKTDSFGSRGFLKAWACLLLPLLILSVLASCGGGDSSDSSGGGVDRGGLTMKVVWPVQPENVAPELIPLASNSLKVQVLQGNPAQVVATGTIDRPESTLYLAGVPKGTAHLLVTAHPGTGGTGVAQAKGELDVTVVGGEYTEFTVTLGTTIAKVEITPNPGAIKLGETANFTATAYDANNNVVIADSTWEWTSGNTSIATVDEDGVVTGVALGTTTLTVEETESNKTKVIDIEVKEEVEPPTNLSQSKLSLHMNGYYPSAKNVILAGPRLLKVMNFYNQNYGQPEHWSQPIIDYKTAYPDGLVDVRIYVDPNAHRYTSAMTPQAAAQDYWTACWNELKNLPANVRAMIDYVEGPNENENFQGVGYTYINDFNFTFTDLCVANGFKPVVVNFSNGWGDPSELAELKTSLEYVVDHDGALGYHGYYDGDNAPDVQSDVNVPWPNQTNRINYTVLRYRQFHQQFIDNGWTKLVGLKMIINECGLVDGGGWRNAIEPGTGEYWRDGVYEDFLTWFDTELRKDDYVIGANIYWTYCDNYSIFGGMETNLLHPWLADYLNSQK